jgi:hypothetical protein
MWQKIFMGEFELFDIDDAIHKDKKIIRPTSEKNLTGKIEIYQMENF